MVRQARYFPTRRAARGPGRLALYSWHDIIALRILLEIFTSFGGKASGWTNGIKDLRQQLDGRFFPNLSGKLAIFADRNSAILGTASQISAPGAALIVPLDPHLAVLADLAGLATFRVSCPSLPASERQI